MPDPLCNVGCRCSKVMPLNRMVKLQVIARAQEPLSIFFPVSHLIQTLAQIVSIWEGPNQDDPEDDSLRSRDIFTLHIQ